MLTNIFDSLSKIISKGDYAETWGNLTIKVSYYSELFPDVQTLCNEIEKYNTLLSPTIRVDSDSILMDEIDDYPAGQFVLIINKLHLKTIDNYEVQFFYGITNFETWLNNISPFNKLLYSKLKIIVNGLNTACGGSNLLITGDFDDAFDTQECLLPTDTIISEHVAIPNGQELSFNCHQYLVTFVNKKKSRPKTTYYDICLIYSCATLCSTFVNELHKDCIILQGIRRIKAPLYNDKTKVSLKFLLLLKEIVEWIYQDADHAKIDIRRKLFLDRVTLDIDYEQPLLNELSLVAHNAFDQAKERYSFVMLERRDTYAKELASLLKDLKVQADLYSSKIRSLLNSFTRDVLAGILLVGFTLFTKFAEIEILAKYNLIEVIFRGLAIYFIISAVMQLITGISDLCLSKRELKYWRKCISETIPKKELDEHVRKSLTPRWWTTGIIYGLLIILYSFVIYITWTFPSIWSKILN